MNRKKRFVLGLVVVAALVLLIVPAVAMADEDDPYYDPYYDGAAWCHNGGYGATALSDRTSLNKVANTLGLTSAKLTARLRAGDTVADMAAEKNVDLQKVVDTALSRHEDLLQRQVTDGDITQTRADNILNLMRDELTTSFEEGFGGGYGFSGYGTGGMMGGFGGYGAGGYGHSGVMGGYGMGGMMGGFGRGGWGW